MEPVKVFFLEPLDRERMWLRRFTFRGRQCPKHTEWGCDAMVPFGERDIQYGKTKDGYRIINPREDIAPPHDDPRWPRKCDACGQPFDDEDDYQLFTRSLYRRLDTNEITTTHDAPVGACWDAWWMTDHDFNRGKTGSGYNIGPDGRCLIVKCPDGHDWMIDSRCSNCTRKDDNEHFCWVRHGRPEDGTLHVDKNGNTCSAGAGSIQTGKWHGFLHNGYLVS